MVKNHRPICFTDKNQRYSAFRRLHQTSNNNHAAKLRPNNVEIFRIKIQWYTSTNTFFVPLCYSICSRKHTPAECLEFLNWNVAERWVNVKRMRCCFTCLQSGHDTASCPSKQRCVMRNCRRYHHPLLHEVWSSAATSRIPSNRTTSDWTSSSQKRSMKSVRPEVSLEISGIKTCHKRFVLSNVKTMPSINLSLNVDHISQH